MRYLIAILLICIQGCLFDTEPQGPIENGKYVFKGTGYSTSESILVIWTFNFMHYEIIKISTSTVGNYPVLNDNSNHQSRSITKSKGTYYISENRIIFDEEDFATGERLSYDGFPIPGFPSIQGNPIEFTPEKLKYSGKGYGLTGGYRIEPSDSGIEMIDSSGYSGDPSLVKLFKKE
jgi:hypothetical protein